MRFFLFISFLLFFLNSSGINDPEISGIREKFYKLTFNSENTESLLTEVRQIENRSGIILAYEAALQALMAKVAWNPFSKMNHVKISHKIFDRAVQKDPRNVEIRFIRFSVEYHIPKWLGLSKNMQRDKDFIMQNINSFDVSCLSKDMLEYIEVFVNECGWYSEGELEEIHKVTGP